MMVQFRTGWPQLEHVGQNCYSPTRRIEIMQSIQRGMNRERVGIVTVIKDHDVFG